MWRDLATNRIVKFRDDSQVSGLDGYMDNSSIYWFFWKGDFKEKGKLYFGHMKTKMSNEALKGNAQ